MVAVVTPRRAAASSFESRILALFPRTLEHVALLRGYLIQHLWFFLFSGGKRPKCLSRLLINRRFRNSLIGFVPRSCGHGRALGANPRFP